MEKKNLVENEWKFLSSLSYAGSHYSIWVRAVISEDGVSLESRALESTIEEIKEAKENYPITYFTNLS